MRRQIVYPGQIPLETDLLSTNKNILIAIGQLIQDVLGTATMFSGLSCVPTSPAGMTVNVNPGRAYSLQATDTGAYSSLPADAHQIVKQGILLDAVNFSCPAPTTAGFSQNFLIQGAFQEIDNGSAVLPYYNAANPAQAFNGPNGTGTTNTTARDNTVQLQIKAGAAATTGTQATPTPDAGFSGLWVVTVAFGATTITSGNISQYVGAPFLTASLLAQIQGAPAGPIGSASNVKAANTVLGQTLNFSADEIVVGTTLAGQAFRIGGFNQTVNTAIVGAGGMDVGSPPNSGFLAIYAIYNPATGAQSILAKNATTGLQPNVYGGANMPAGYTASALISIWPTSSTGKFNGGYQRNREVVFPQLSALSTSTTQATYTSLSIAGIVPANAVGIKGTGQVSSTATSSLGLNLASDASGSGLCAAIGANGVSIAGGYTAVQIVTPQTIFYTALSTGGTPTFNIGISGYTI